MLCSGDLAPDTWISGVMKEEIVQELHELLVLIQLTIECHESSAVIMVMS